MHTKLLILIVFKPRREVKDSMRRVEPEAKKFTYVGADPNRIHFQKYATTSVEIICSELSFYLRFDLRVENFTCGVRSGECKRSLCQIQVFIIIIYY